MPAVAIVHNHPIHYQHLLFCALAARGMDFEVLFTARSGQARLEAPLPANAEYLYSIGHDGSYETAAATPTARFVWRSLDRIQPAVVILCGYADTAAWTGWLWAGMHGAARILWAESNLFDHRRHRWKELPKRMFVRNCQLAHTYGTSSRDYIESLGMPRERIQSRRAVADTALFLGGDDVENTGPIRLLYCGRLSPEKNLEALLRAFAQLGQNPESPSMVLRLVGHGPLKHYLREVAEKLGIGKIVKFAGSQPQSALPAIFRQSDLLILPSVREPWGLVVNEAMLSGLPVAVSTQCGCVADLVRPENGWTFSPHDTAELAKLLGQIADTPRVVLRQMGRAGRTLAHEYSPENCARTVVNMVDTLLRVPRGGTLAARAGD
jgi:glycosyltransferase involved in cell wall biosynthesis